MRTDHVKACRKSPGKCGHCGKEIPVGAPYKSIKGRHGPKKVRCESCPDWRPSERTSSDKLSNLYAARESVEDALKGWSGDDGDASDLRTTLEEAAATAEEVAEEYRSAAEAWEGKGPAEEWEEKAEQCEAWKEELESAASDIEDFDEEDATDEIKQEKTRAKDSPQQMPESVGTDGTIAVETPIEEAEDLTEELDKKREEWAEEVKDKVQGAIDALEL